MELKSLEMVADYRLLFVQPDPESGERLCIGLVIGDDELMYDREFSRARCLSRDLDVDILRFYLEDLRAKLFNGNAPIDSVLGSSAPLLTSSLPRKVTLPITAEKKARLFQHFVLRDASTEPVAESFRREPVSTRSLFVQRVKNFANLDSSMPFDALIENAKPSDILGVEEKNIGRIALAVRRDSLMFLIDGVDLNNMTPKKALSEAEKVRHIFWQYKRIGTGRGFPLSRIALVFNGNSHTDSILRETHDYTVDQFKRETELTIDTSDPEAARDLSAFVEAARLAN